MGTARVRRNSYVNEYANTQRLLSGGVVQSTSNSNIAMYNFQYCQDELNEMSLMGKTNSYDIGGGLLSLSAKADFPVAATSAQVDAFGLRWDSKGPIIALPVAYWGSNVSNATWEGNVYASVGLDSIIERIGKGATAISRCRPAKPQASLAVSVTEMLREGIPHTLKQVAHLKEEVAAFRSLANSYKGKMAPSKYLEYQFGWKPLVSDIRKTSSALMNYERILEDLRRNSGKRMRRGYTFPAVTSTSEYLRDWNGPWPSLNSYLLQQAGQRVVTIESTKRTWFKGEFIYTYPSADAAIPRQIMAGARQLLGLDLTPETIWNVAPWTWLADWEANIGDVVANFTAIGADNLVMRYGYLMQEAEQVWKHTHYGVTIQGTSVQNQDISGTFTQSAKTRIGASPFGFGLTFDQLDARQIGILTSIGITGRGRH